MLAVPLTHRLTCTSLVRHLPTRHAVASCLTPAFYLLPCSTCPHYHCHSPPTVALLWNTSCTTAPAHCVDCCRATTATACPRLFHFCWRGLLHLVCAVWFGYCTTLPHANAITPRSCSTAPPTCPSPFILRLPPSTTCSPTLLPFYASPPLYHWICTHHHWRFSCLQTVVCSAAMPPALVHCPSPGAHLPRHHHHPNLTLPLCALTPTTPFTRLPAVYHLPIPNTTYAPFPPPCTALGTPPPSSSRFWTRFLGAWVYTTSACLLAPRVHHTVRAALRGCATCGLVRTHTGYIFSFAVPSPHAFARLYWLRLVGTRTCWLATRLLRTAVVELAFHRCTVSALLHTPLQDSSLFYFFCLSLIVTYLHISSYRLLLFYIPAHLPSTGTFFYYFHTSPTVRLFVSFYTSSLNHAHGVWTSLTLFSTTTYTPHLYTIPSASYLLPGTAYILSLPPTATLPYILPTHTCFLLL